MQQTILFKAIFNKIKVKQDYSISKTEYKQTKNLFNLKKSLKLKI
jgi:hypothetical protein